jgi:hypothetical protein
VTAVQRGSAAGEAYLAETPLLRGHAGTQPDLFLRWNRIPADAATIDVVVHLHGFSERRDAMPLSEKVARSGLDLAARARPTLAVLPRGNWLGRTWYDFPALLAGGLDRLVDHALGQVADRPLAVDRLLLTAHSGGVMPALDALAGLRRQPDELHLFDGLYGHDPATGDPLRGLGVLDAWLEERLGREPARPGALRVLYLERQTGPMSRALAALLARRLAALEPELGARLARRYRVEPAGVPHGYVASICSPVLLADPAADFDWSRI